jgi:tetratricopeptide (TPR) repeat protein
MGIKLDQALDLISRAMEQKPEDGYILDSMGWVHYQKQDYEKAVYYLERAAQLSDFESIIAGHLADAYEKNGQLTLALTTYKKALANVKKPTVEKKESVKKEKEKQTRELKEKIEKLKKKLNEK